MLEGMIRAILFDCFGVLYVDASHAFYEQKVPDYDRLKPRLDELNAQSDYGLISQNEWYEQVAETAGLAVADVRQGIQSEHQRNERLIEYTGQLRQRGVLVGMVSNIGSGAMDRFFAPAERGQLFDAVVLSGEEMVTKPSPVIFELAAERLGVSPGECLMIDDRADNCAGADAAGMQSVQYETTEQVIAAVESALQKSFDISEIV